MTDVHQGSLLSAIPEPDEATFDGEGQDESDHDRLRGQMLRLHAAMCDGKWYTLAMLSEKTGDPESSISANFRSFRKEKFGAYAMYREKEPGGLHWYRMGEKGAGRPSHRQAITPAHELALRAADELIAFTTHRRSCATLSRPLRDCNCGLLVLRTDYREARQATREKESN